MSTMDEVDSSTWDLVHEGMRRMVENSSTFSGLDFDMAGKTGTAQQSSVHADHALSVMHPPILRRLLLRSEWLMATVLPMRRKSEEI